MKFTPVANGFRLTSLTKEFLRRGNKHMAIFLDYEYLKQQRAISADEFKLLKLPKVGWWKKETRKDDYSEKYFLCRSHNKLPFLRDWNWLMKIVEKIEILETKQDGHFGVYISSNSCTIQQNSLILRFLLYITT